MATLREIRVSRLLSIRALAELAGVSPFTVVEVEARRRRPRYSTMGHLAVALGVEPTEVDEFREALEMAARGAERNQVEEGQHVD